MCATVPAALQFFCVLLVVSCRQPEATDDAGPLPVFHLAFRPGDRFQSDGWRTASYGFVVDSTRRRHTQDVITTSGQAGGASDVIVIADSAVTVRTGQTARDTIYLRLTGGGNLLQYGLLSGLVKKREGREIPKRWDVVYEAGSSTWTVGSVDAAGTEKVIASVNGTPEYFQVALNTNPTLVPAYRISMSGSKLDFYVWISDSPTCFPRVQEESEPLAGIPYGERRLLTDRISPP